MRTDVEVVRVPMYDSGVQGHPIPMWWAVEVGGRTTGWKYSHVENAHVNADTFRGSGAIAHRFDAGLL